VGFLIARFAKLSLLNGKKSLKNPASAHKKDLIKINTEIPDYALGFFIGSERI